MSQINYKVNGKVAFIEFSTDALKILSNLRETLGLQDNITTLVFLPDLSNGKAAQGNIPKANTSSKPADPPSEPKNIPAPVPEKKTPVSQPPAVAPPVHSAEAISKTPVVTPPSHTVTVTAQPQKTTVESKPAIAVSSMIQPETLPELDLEPLIDFNEQQFTEKLNVDKSDPKIIKISNISEFSSEEYPNEPITPRDMKITKTENSIEIKFLKADKYSYPYAISALGKYLIKYDYEFTPLEKSISQFISKSLTQSKNSAETFNDALKYPELAANYVFYPDYKQYLLNKDSFANSTVKVTVPKLAASFLIQLTSFKRKSHGELKKKQYDEGFVTLCLIAPFTVGLQRNGDDITFLFKDTNHKKPIPAKYIANQVKRFISIMDQNFCTTLKFTSVDSKQYSKTQMYLADEAPKYNVIALYELVNMEADKKDFYIYICAPKGTDLTDFYKLIKDGFGEYTQI